MENAYFDLFYQVQAWYEKVKKIVKILLPDYEDTGQKQKKSQKDIANRYLKDKTSLYELGFTYRGLQKMPDELCRELFSVSPGRDGENISKIDFVISLSRILEFELRRQIIFNGNLDVSKTKDEMLECIRNRNGADIPYSITSVRDVFLKEAVLGRKATLGAYTLVWLFGQCDRLDKKQIGETLCFIDKILTWRMHGNDINLNVDSVELFSVRDKVLDFVKNLEV